MGLKSLGHSEPSGLKPWFIGRCASRLDLGWKRRVRAPDTKDAAGRSCPLAELYQEHQTETVVLSELP